MAGLPATGLRLGDGQQPSPRHKADWVPFGTVCVDDVEVYDQLHGSP